jgi:hypothetical protein
MPSEHVIQARADVDRAKQALRTWGQTTDAGLRDELHALMSGARTAAVDKAKAASRYTTVGALLLGLLAGRAALGRREPKPRAKVPKLVSLASAIGLARAALPLARVFLNRGL